MKISVTNVIGILRFPLTILLLLLYSSMAFTQVTSVQGIVRDSVTNKPIEFATISFENTTVGRLTDENGKFSLSNNLNKNVIVVSWDMRLVESLCL